MSKYLIRSIFDMKNVSRTFNNIELWGIDAILSICHIFKYHKTSGVVGRERMGTAFPHKKLSGNGVPTREILRDIFFIIAIKLATLDCYHVTHPVHIKPCQNYTSSFAMY